MIVLEAQNDEFQPCLRTNEPGMLSYGHSGSHFEKYTPSVDIFNLRGTGFCVLVNQ